MDFSTKYGKKCKNTFCCDLNEHNLYEAMCTFTTPCERTETQDVNKCNSLNFSQLDGEKDFFLLHLKDLFQVLPPLGPQRSQVTFLLSQ